MDINETDSVLFRTYLGSVGVLLVMTFLLLISDSYTFNGTLAGSWYVLSALGVVLIGWLGRSALRGASEESIWFEIGEVTK